METTKKFGSTKKTKRKKYSLLYVDDEVANLRVFRANFRKHFNIFTTPNPLEARDILKEHDIQVIITDQRMPEMTGTSLLEKILPDFPNIIKIILTGFSDIEAIKKGVNECGIYKYITKPWNFEEMKISLDQGLELYQKSIDGEEHVKKLKTSNVGLESEVKERRKEIENTNKRLIEHIKYAGFLQQSMLPSEQYLNTQFTDHFLIFEPKYFFSEEFIWTARLNFRTENYTIVVLIELDGKGMIGSLKTLIASSILHYLVYDMKLSHPGEIINEVKYELDIAGSGELQCDTMVSVALFDHYTHQLRFSGVKQDMIVFNGDEMTLLKGSSMENFKDSPVEKRDIVREATYYMFSNGLFHQENEEGIKFTTDQFQEMLKCVQGKSLAEQKAFISDTLKNWKASKNFNRDVSIIGFQL